jgi:hypothetical protein
MDELPESCHRLSHARVEVTVEHRVGELFPHAGFIVTNRDPPGRAVVLFDNQRGTAE